MIGNYIVSFASVDKNNINMLIDYLIDIVNIKYTLSMEVSDKLYLVIVPKKDYKKSILYGKKFINDNNINNIFWVDPYGCLVKKDELNICYMKLPSNKKGNKMWGIDKHLPRDIYYYLKGLESYLGTNIYQEYISNEEESGLIVTVKGDDYKKYMNDLKNYIILNGIGVFTSIEPMTEYGLIMNNKVKRKIR